MSNYMDLSVTELHDLLKSKKIKPIDLVNEALEKIENYKLNDFITINEKARKEALELENTEVDNLFWGIPIAIKDNIVTKDLSLEQRKEYSRVILKTMENGGM